MATLFQPAATRQPFAPINGSRLQSLTSLKNRQNAVSTTFSTPTKRKAAVYDHDAASPSYSDDENIDPSHFASPKRSKGGVDFNGCTPKADIFKPFQSPAFVLKRATSPQLKNLSRPMLNPRSPASKLIINPGMAMDAHANMSAPAGRSPTRKRIGILNRRRTASTSTSSSSAFGSRVDPPSFGAAAPPFSLAAALSGSIPSSKAKLAAAAPVPVSLHEPEIKKGWFFEIHEDTEAELQHNLMEHGACTLDISSDEEADALRAEMRGKENVPPLDDISQTSTIGSAPLRAQQAALDAGARDAASCTGKSWRELRRQKMESGAIEVDRSPLGDLAAEEFYASGLTAEDVILVAEEDDEDGHETEREDDEVLHKFEFTVEVDLKGKQKEIEAEAQAQLEEDFLLSVPAPARVLEPIERAEEGWSVWESGSAKGDEC